MKSNTLTRYDGIYVFRDTSREVVRDSQRTFMVDFSVTANKTALPVNSPVVNEFRWSRRKATYFSGFVRHEYPSGDFIDETKTSEVFGILPDTFGDLLGDGAVLGKAYSKFLGKIRNSAANLAVDVAETGATYKMVSSSVDTVIELARKAFKHPTKSMSDAWLQYKYGWQPALSTIYEVANFSRTNLLRLSVKAAASENLVFTGTRLNSSTYPVKYRTNHRAVVRWGCTMDVKNPVLYDVKRLTSLNPLTIAWELVPYSFVVDWFYDIGGFLDDIETVVGGGYNVSNIYRSIYRQWSSEQDLDMLRYGYLSAGGNTYCKEIAKAKAFSQYTTFQRVPFQSLPLPRLPTLNAHLGAQRILSGAALLNQLRK